MGFFSNIIRKVSSGVSHNQDKELLKKIKLQLEILVDELYDYKILQKKLYKKIGKKKGALDVKKSEFIELELIHKSREFIKEIDHSLTRDFNSTNTIPEDPIFSREIIEIYEVLKNVDKLVVFLNKNISKQNNDEENLAILNETLREVTNVFRKYYERERKEEYLRQKRGRNISSKLVKKIYYGAHYETFGKNKILIYRLPKDNFQIFFNEAANLNRLHKLGYKVIYHQFWTDNPHFEKDYTTGLNEEHINVAIKFEGKKFKKIHLLVA